MQATAGLLLAAFCLQGADEDRLSRFVDPDAAIVVHVPDTGRLVRKLDRTVYQRLQKFPGWDLLEEELERRFGEIPFEIVKVMGAMRGGATFAVSGKDGLRGTAIFDTGFPINLHAPMLAAMIGPPWKKKREKIEGTPVFAISGPVTFYLASRGRYFVAANKRGAMEDLLRRMRGKADPSLASSKGYRRAASELKGVDASVFIRSLPIGGRSARWIGAGISFDRNSLKVSFAAPEPKD